MKYILMIAAMIILAGCNNDSDNGEVVVVGNDSQSASVQHEAEDDGAEEEIFTVTEGTEEEETAEPENNAEIEVGGDDFSINNLEPNAVAQLVNEGDFEIVSESDKDFYEKITDIDDDGTDETVQILKNTDIDEDSVLNIARGLSH